MWALIQSAFAIVAGWIGLKSKAADASKVSADQAAGIAVQRVADLTESNNVQAAEIQAGVSGAAGPGTADRMRNGSF
jgi:hypothetical protein